MLNKVTYTEGVTLIRSQNLNEIQDAVIENESDIGDLQTSVSELESDVSGLGTDVSGLQTDVSDLQSHAVFDAPATDGTYVLKVTVSDGTPTYEWVEEVADESGD